MQRLKFYENSELLKIPRLPQDDMIQSINQGFQGWYALFKCKGFGGFAEKAHSLAHCDAPTKIHIEYMSEQLKKAVLWNCAAMPHE